MNFARKTISMVLLTSLIILAGCAAPCSQIPREALKPLPDIKMPAEPALNTKKLIDSKTGQPAGLFFPTESAFKEANYKVDLREVAELGAANTRGPWGYSNKPESHGAGLPHASRGPILPVDSNAWSGK